MLLNSVFMKTFKFCNNIFTLFILSILQSNAQMVQVNIIENKIAINYNHKYCITGGIPVDEGNSNFIFQRSQKGQIPTFTFTNNVQEINVLVKLTEYSNVIGFYLNQRGFQEGSKFKGLFFSDMPNFKVGVQIWRYKPWNSWTKPIRVKDPSQLEDWDVQFFYWQYTDGTYGAAIPLSGNGFRSTLGKYRNCFGTKAYTYSNCIVEKDIPMMAVGFGPEPYTLFEQLYEAGLTLMGKSENLRKNKKYPAILEYIGWCSWNSSEMGKNLNETFLYDVAKSFVKNKFPIPLMIIDDGWSENINNQLSSYSPKTEKFHNGLKPVIDNLKTNFAVKYVGIWHAFNGYWSGIDPSSPLGKKYGNSLFKWTEKSPINPNDTGKQCFMINPFTDSLSLFYTEWHAYLKSQGVDFLKVDNQSVVERMSAGNFLIWDIAENMHKALYQSVDKYFNGTVINCMDMTNDAFYNFGSSAIARVVEDYFPYEENETYDLQKGNAAAHITQALYNSLYFQQMVWPDFDMFETYNPNATFHAIARAISGGPIYITDKPGKQNFEILQPLVFADGKIIRADIPARLTYDCLFQVQDKAPLKAFSFANNAGLLAIWNASDTDLVSGSFKVDDIIGIKGEKFVVYEFFSKQVKVVSRTQPISISLGRMKYSYYNVVPIVHGVAAIGLINKLNAPKTIKSQKIEMNKVEFVIPEGGTFAVFLERQPSKVLFDGVPTKNFQFSDNLVLHNLYGNSEHSIIIQF